MSVMEWIAKHATLPPPTPHIRQGPHEREYFKDSRVDVLQYMSYTEPQTVASLVALTGASPTQVRKTLSLELDCGNIQQEGNTGVRYYLAHVEVPSLRSGGVSRCRNE